MKKRFVAFFLAMMFAFTCSLPAFAAEGFDESVLKNAEGLENVEEGCYTVAALTSADNWYELSDKGDGLLFFPEVAVNSNDETFMFVLNYDFNTTASSALNIQYLTFVIDGKYYTFSVTDNAVYNYIRDTGEKWTVEMHAITLDAGSLTLMNALAQPHEGDVIFGVYGGPGWRLFLLNQSQIDSILYLYNLYVQAGGTREANLSQIPAGSGTEFEISE